jgi:serine/threonine-protein kinase
MDLPGIEGYTIDGVLGHGATGTVVSGVQIAVDRPVAIKFLHPELCSDKRAIIRLQREARAAARLAHPGIISAVDMGVSEGRWWYAMELVEGISLAERIEERGTLTEREAIRLFAPIVDALEHAHGMGVIHRDVKPANILIDGRGRARLVDLGLAWAETDPRVTSGGTLGTPHYISPEQARNPSDVDGRSDIWSLGATLFHALTGRPPFVGDSVAEVLSGVLYQPMPDPRGLVPGLSKGISLVLRKCLSRDPNLRYRAPLELLKDLERLRERRAPKVRPEELEPLTHGPGRTLRLVGVGVLGLVAAGGWVAWWQPWSTDQPERIRSMDVSEWPALDEVRRGLEGGTVSLRRSEESLALLVSPAVGGAPPVELRGDLARLRLSWDSQLDGALSALLTEVGVYLDRSLSNGSLAEAALYLNQELPRRVMRATGYSTIEECPDSFSGKQHALARWQGLVASADAEGRQRQIVVAHR